MTGQAAYSQCWELIKTQRFAEALSLARQLTTSHPNRDECFYTLCMAARGARQSELALNAIETACKLAPTNNDYKALRCLCLLSTGRANQAIKDGRALGAVPGLSAYALNTLSLLFQATDQFEDQLTTTQKLVEHDPSNAVGMANYAEVLRNLGRLEEAEAAYNKVIALDPSATSAFWGRSQCYTASPDHNSVDALEAALKQDKRDWRSTMQLFYALGKEQEELRRHKEAFAAYAAGARARHDHLVYDVQGDVDTMLALAAAYDKGPIEGEGDPTNQPIFVVGLPRSGTTLVERILGSHPDVKDAGELQDFPIEMVKQVKVASKGGQLTKLETVAASTQIDFSALGGAYMQAVMPRIGVTKHFVDKLPLNYLNLGVIARALPNAKIVLLVRNPMDSCFAMFKTLFAEAYPFSYSLNDLGVYYVAWRQLMMHWKALLKDRLHIVRYETLVTETETTVRDLIAHCGLEWNDACLNFHEREDGVSTASAAQVRQPIYSSSLEKWRRYEGELSPLKRHLEAAGVPLDTMPKQELI